VTATRSSSTATDDVVGIAANVPARSGRLPLRIAEPLVHRAPCRTAPPGCDGRKEFEMDSYARVYSAIAASRQRDYQAEAARERRHRALELPKPIERPANARHWDFRVRLPETSL
jgi:hypothetical protein